MNSPTIAIIGAGNMGSALISGLIANHYSANKIWASDPSSEKLKEIQDKYHIAVTTENEKAIQPADLVIFAVKPQLLSSVAREAATLLQTKKPLVISIAAGIREHRLQQWLGGKIPIVRCMPNTPALIGCGASALYANSYTSDQQRNLAESILRSVGTTLWLDDERLMDAVTALSGSGPAYFFLMMEAMQQAGQDLGLPEEVARLLTLQTAYGAARLALESDEPVSVLRQRVTSPGGTTESALQVLEKGDFCRLIASALFAAQKRADELANKTETTS